MRNANFKIPTEQVLRTGASTYKEKISDLTQSNQLAGDAAKLLTNLKHSSVKIGSKGSKLDSATEQAEQFVNPNFNTSRGIDLKNNAIMKNYLKGHHFELGSKNQKMSQQVEGPHSVITNAPTQE